MTNAQIILENSIFLMNEGLLKPTSEMTTINGKEVFIPEEIHTFNGWKKKGYQVQKGEHAIAKFPIWKFKANKKQEQEAEEEEKQNGKMFMKVAFFFTRDQVKEIK